MKIISHIAFESRDSLFRDICVGYTWNESTVREVVHVLMHHQQKFPRTKICQIQRRRNYDHNYTYDSIWFWQFYSQKWLNKSVPSVAKVLLPLILSNLQNLRTERYNKRAPNEFDRCSLYLSNWQMLFLSYLLPFSSKRGLKQDREQYLCHW